MWGAWGVLGGRDVWGVLGGRDVCGVCWGGRDACDDLIIMTGESKE